MKPKITRYVIRYGRYGVVREFPSGVFDLLRKVYRWAKDGRCDVIAIGKETKEL